MIKVTGFIIINPLGRGTYGQRFNKLVAIKCIQKTSLNKRGEDNLISEISILKSLEHPHIVSLLDFSWDSTNIYLIMDYCAGGDLGKYLKLKKRLNEKLVHHFLQQLAFALQYLHGKNIVHMDIKPQNILLTSINRPSLKLADFGFAKSIEGSVRMNELRGTYLYMAPEVFRDAIYHASCDLWSVGVIIYECLFGAAPFASLTLKELTDKLSLDEPIVLPSNVHISESCSHLLLGLLKRKPTDRLSSEEFFKHPFIDLDHVPSATSLTRAMNELSKAEELERTDKLPESYSSYLEGLNHLMAASQYEQSNIKKTEIKELIRTHLIKAENLKARITSPSKCKPPRPEPTFLKSNNGSIKPRYVSSLGTTTIQSTSEETSTAEFKLDQRNVSTSQLENEKLNSSVMQSILSVFTGPKQPVTNGECGHSSQVDMITRIKRLGFLLCSRPVSDNYSIPKNDRTKSLVIGSKSKMDNQSKSDDLNKVTVPTGRLIDLDTDPTPVVDQPSSNSIELNQSDLAQDPNCGVDQSNCSSAYQYKWATLNQRLSNLVPYNVDADVMEFLNNFYVLASKMFFKHALEYFETRFELCLQVVKCDLDEKRRDILFKELNYSMNIAEEFKSKLKEQPKLASNFEMGEYVQDNGCPSM